MKEVTQLLGRIQQGDSHAAEQLLPLVYDELRRLAGDKISWEKAGQTLQPTALVHEAYLRLVDTDRTQQWANQGHFFAAAAEAMRRILIENARRKKRCKHGGDLKRVELEERDVMVEPLMDEIEALDEALTRLAEEDADAAQVVQLHFFGGLSIDRVAEILGVSRATAYRQWSYARAWLRCRIESSGEHSPVMENASGR